MFGKMIASELKKFPENLKFHLKHDINQVIYDYNLNQSGFNLFNHRI